MLKQKQTYIPKVNNVDVTGWNAATDFTSDFIEFPESTQWLLDVQDWASVIAGAPVLSILVSNSQDGEYKNYSTLASSIDLTVANNRVIYDEIFSSRYMKIQYTSGGSTGTFDLILSK
jgi:hypothetical protein